MIFMGEGLFLVELVLLVYCVLNIATTPEHEVRNLPRMVWLLLVVVLPLAGGIAWLAAGRPLGPPQPRPRARAVPSAYDRPGRATAASPDDDVAFLEGLRARADAQREAAARERRAALEREEAERSRAWRERQGRDPQG
jgi:hypothetical protein